ncbi:hypothetical protein QQM39_21110 [Streptomyces sp. DT2A-34]|uniref:hypothetical protein n=1 Tax=Streptomyces sp. DT2A-34 TaxID=3051182 RepID=UPI00265C771F|nr:hypothetical protein [Streptomyces sp. DT2A-34]MDO0913253.1 hypothetical protein [Streptomyces sp. DT2A-34]
MGSDAAYAAARELTCVSAGDRAGDRALAEPPISIVVVPARALLPAAGGPAPPATRGPCSAPPCPGPASSPRPSPPTTASTPSAPRPRPRLNGVALVYFAAYFAIVDAVLAYWRHLGRTDAAFLRRRVTDQRLRRFGNVDTSPPSRPRATTALRHQPDGSGLGCHR